MVFDGQVVVVVVIVVVATSYLIIRGWRALLCKTNSGCGGCGGSCEKIRESGDDKGFVSVEDLQGHARHR
jgi:hypothetical protein